MTPEFKKNALEKINHFVHSISTKVLILILVIVLPFNFLALALSKRSMNMVVEQAQISVKSILENYITDLRSKMVAAEHIAYNMRFNDSNGQALMKGMGDEAYDAIRLRFYYAQRKVVILYDAADVYYYYLPGTDDAIIWDISGGSRSEDEEYIRSFCNTENPGGGWKLEKIGERPALRLFISLDGVSYGSWIFLDDILNKLETDVQYKQAEFYFSEEKQRDEKDIMAVNAYEKKGGLYLNGRVLKREIYGSVSKIYSFFRTASFLALSLVPILYLMIQHMLLSPLRTLNQAQARLRKGDMDYRIKEQGNSVEYAHTFESFNEMAENIRSLKIENYEKELKRQRMELENLQLQIRPHFLLNIFNMIYNLAQRKEEGAIQDAILYLSDYFRYLFRSGKSLELFEKEQHLMESYIRTVNVRYPGNVEIEYQYDPEIAFVRIPPLLLHNFVENIVKHVVKKGRVTHISIVGQYSEGDVTFMIMDDGPGMEEETLDRLNTLMRQEPKDGEHIGYSNSWKRLRYFYGDTADIVISSELGEGTCVTVSFPYDLEQEE